MDESKIENDKTEPTLVPNKNGNKLGLRVVCISDTHSHNVPVPAGDVLIHAGDYTHFGKEEDFLSFNEWLSLQPHPVKIVVNGNHESNAFRDKRKASSLLTSCTYLVNEGVSIPFAEDKVPLNVFGLNFFWPCHGHNPYYDLIPDTTDILVSHGPVKGFVDDNVGCPALLERVKHIRPRLVVCGHIHQAHGVTEGVGELEGVTFVNAAMCLNGYQIGWSPIVVDL